MRARHTEDPTEPPRFISWEDYRERLRVAGWLPDEIDAHIQEILEDEESGE